MRRFTEPLKQNELLKIIDEPSDVEFEISYIAYVEAKRFEEGKALLFAQPIREKKAHKYPVLMNTFCNQKALNLALTRDYEEVADEISQLTKLHIPTSLKAKFGFFTKLSKLRFVPPKRLQKEKVLYRYELLLSLKELPILKTWSLDAAPFITMSQIYTQNPDKTQNNLGMYCLQVSGENELLMHWQIHKDGTNFCREHKKAGLSKMPVSVAIGGDPLYIWCAQALLPEDIFELLLYGFIRRQDARLTSCGNGIFVPYDSDLVIEGYVDLENFKIEGPFSDHTGFYTPLELFPVMKVDKIYAKKDAVYQATVVGKPPLEDRVMGLGTGRISLPLLQTTMPSLLDYKMPENGVFYDLILTEIDAHYPAHAQRTMHALWDVGQMSFVKHALFVDKDASNLEDYKSLIPYILNRFNVEKVYISQDICGQLDHASPNTCFGDKAALGATCSFNAKELETLSDEMLKSLLEKGLEIHTLKRFYTECRSLIVYILYGKKESVEASFGKLLKYKKYSGVLIFLDEENHLESLYMLVWRVVNNLDAQRDIFIKNDCIALNATAKNEFEAYQREWPKQTDYSKKVVENLILRNIIEEDTKLFRQFEIFG